MVVQSLVIDLTKFFCERLNALNKLAPPKPRVLVVDDDPAFLDLVKAIADDLNIETAITPEDAIAIIDAAQPFSRVVVDLNLNSSKTGIDIIEKLRAAMPAIPVTIVTGLVGSDDDELESSAIKNGFRFVRKQDGVIPLKKGIEP
jgi:CheY-like chemotaxis protein